jgi:hypothetical protein
MHPYWGFKMTKESVYSAADIDAICNEVERQWQYHLFARAAFPHGIEGKTNWNTDSNEYRFYHDRGAQLKVTLPGPLPAGVQDIGHWLNQNYIIRLFGTLDEHWVLKAGKNANDPSTGIVARLRQRVGAHTSGYWNPEENDEDSNLTELIRGHLDPSVDDEAIRQFNLSIDTVLFRLKENCLSFVRSLIGKKIPPKKRSSKGDRS